MAASANAEGDLLNSHKLALFQHRFLSRHYGASPPRGLEEPSSGRILILFLNSRAERRTGLPSQAPSSISISLLSSCRPRGAARMTAAIIDSWTDWNKKSSFVDCTYKRCWQNLKKKLYISTARVGNIPLCYRQHLPYFELYLTLANSVFVFLMPQTKCWGGKKV